MTKCRPKFILLWFDIPRLPAPRYFGALLEGHGGWSACSFAPLGSALQVPFSSRSLWAVAGRREAKGPLISMTPLSGGPPMSFVWQVSVQALDGWGRGVEEGMAWSASMLDEWKVGRHLDQG